METSIKFTVIIPTRERPDTLLHSLRTVVMQDYEDLTILVSDNFSQDNTKQVIDSFHDPRIKYINPGKRLSMSHHFDFALNHVKDGWVSFVMDDDGLLPGALTKVAQVIKKTGCQTVTSHSCWYEWPGDLLQSDTLIVSLNKGIEWRNARVWLGKFMRGEFDTRELPYLYTGSFVDSKIINKARSSEGVFFNSRNPDSYSEIALCSVLDDYVMLKDTVSIIGVSSHSVGGAHFGTVKSQDAFRKFISEENIPLHSRLAHKDWPKSAQIHYYEAYLQSEHLHHDFLKIKMEDQLALALAKISPNGYQELRKYCVDIAKRDGIEMSQVDAREKMIRAKHPRWERLEYWKYRINRSLNARVLSGKGFGVQDVYGASILAKGILLNERPYLKFLQGAVRFIIKKTLQVLRIKES